MLTLKGLRQSFVLAFIHVRSRRVIISPATFKPDAVRVTEQAEGFLAQSRESGLSDVRVMHAHDDVLTAPYPGIWFSPSANCCL